MFAGSVQPDIVSLFSSTGSDPLGLFSLHVDGSLPSDSFFHLLNDSTSLPAPPPPAVLISTPSVYRDEHSDTSQGHQLSQTVLHIQSPTLRKTFIQCLPSAPSSSDSGGLGLKHTWLHIQVRNLARDWSFEVGIVDKMGRQGIVRCSTFQKLPKLVRNRNASPLLHLPLVFLPPSSNALTTWSTIALNLPHFVSQFASLARVQSSSGLMDAHYPAERVTRDVQPGPLAFWDVFPSRFHKDLCDLSFMKDLVEQIRPLAENTVDENIGSSANGSS